MCGGDAHGNRQTSLIVTSQSHVRSDSGDVFLRKGEWQVACLAGRHADGEGSTVHCIFLLWTRRICQGPHVWVVAVVVGALERSEVHGEEATLGEKRASFPAEAVVAGHSKARNVHDVPRCDFLGRADIELFFLDESRGRRR